MRSALTEEHHLYPECTVTLAFLHGESYIGAGAALKRLPRVVYLREYRDFPARLCARGVTRMVSVGLYPWGAIRLLGLPREESATTRFVNAPVSPQLAERMERLLEAGHLDEALRLLEEWLLTRAAQVSPEVTPAVTAATRLFEAGGRGSVATLADSVGLSLRQLERQFQAQVGMTPKFLARVSRFEATAQELYRERKPSFTSLAYERGYADQAHLSREFRAFAALSPGSFAAEARDFVRHQGNVAFVQAQRSTVF